MPITVKDLLAAARATVPAVSPAAAADMVKNADAVVVDVRDGTEVAASGKVKGALAISRGLLEFRADPALPTYEPALRKDRPVILYCGSGGRAALAGKTLLDMGFTDVRNVGGFKDLVAAGWPVDPG
ncbi:MAG: rhodanese-like domain-containing protein [Rhodopila sp.]|nr:rhodanese-like domain-containing protein [Rhodopila sp.]